MTGVTKSSELSSQARKTLSFVDAALGVAGHSITDPVLRGLLEDYVEGRISSEEYKKLTHRHILGH